MKYFVFLFILTLLLSFRLTEDLYSIIIKRIDGKKIVLNSFKGKKVLIVIVPFSQTDTTLSLKELAELQTRYPSIFVIGIPAEDAGYKRTDEMKIKEMYKAQSVNFILTEAMKVKKTAANGQALLFQWLTDKNKNNHFDREVDGTGHKFFIDERGQLYAVMGPRVELSNPIIDRILSKPFMKH